MSIIKKFFLTSRYNKPYGIFLLFFPCIWGLNLNKVNISEELLLCIFFFLGACGMRALGCIWNDYTDKDFDIRVKRTRERLIASNKVNNKEVILFCCINAFIGSLPLYFIPLHSIFISFCILPIIFIYPFMKRITWWPQFWLGLCFNWGIIVGYSIYNDFFFSLELILFYLGSVLFTIGYDTIYGFQDLKDDEIIGIKSTSLKFKNNSMVFLLITYFIAFSLWFFSLILLNKTPMTLLAFVSICLLILIKIIFTNIKNPKDCETTFNYNTYFSFALTVILFIS